MRPLGSFSSTTAGWVLTTSAHEATYAPHTLCRYTVHVRMASGSGASNATISVIVTDANDLRVTHVFRLDNGPLDDLPTSGRTVIIFEGTGLGRLDPRLPTDVSASYANAAGDTYDAIDCRVERPGEALRCTTVKGHGGGFTWTLRVDGFVVPHGDIPLMRYMPPTIRAVTDASAMELRDGRTEGGDVVCVSAPPHHRSALCC